SRRRHTSFSRDWSSDVCSSDLGGLEPPVLLARAQGDPADGLAAEVADEAGDAAALHEAAHGVADAAPDLPVLGVRHPVVHAVAEIGRASCREGEYRAASGVETR